MQFNKFFKQKIINKLFFATQGESTDNFNWGVRRRPLSEGEEREPSLQHFEESISEKTPSSCKHTIQVSV